MILIVSAGAPQGRGGQRGSEPPSAAGRRSIHSQRVGAPASGPAAPTEAEIRAAVGQLNHPGPARRRAAIRQLAHWGPVVFPALEQAAAGPDLEAALLARDLLEEFQSAILVGAGVRLHVNPPRIAWDEPISLTVYAHNPTTGPIRVPWPAPRKVTTTRPVPDDAGQVAAMLDAADFLTVTAPDGEQLDLRVEPLERNRAVYRAVDARARGTPPSHTIAPGATARLEIPQFNRGWARYPMLSAGRYTIKLAYQPKWKDESWTQEGFGLVEADPITVEVHREAPELIRRSPRPVLLSVERAGDTLIAGLQNTWDRELWINLNVGGDLLVYAMIEWRLFPRQGGDMETLTLKTETTGPQFRMDRVRRLAPGERLVISVMPLAVIGRRIRQEGVSESSAFDLTVRYTHLAAGEQLRERLRHRIRAADVPTHLFSGSVSSEPISLASLESK